MSPVDLFRVKKAKDKVIDAYERAEDRHIAAKLEAMRAGNSGKAAAHDAAASILRRAARADEDDDVPKGLNE